MLETRSEREKIERNKERRKGKLVKSVLVQIGLSLLSVWLVYVLSGTWTPVQKLEYLLMPILLFSVGFLSGAIYFKGLEIEGFIKEIFTKIKKILLKPERGS